MEAKIQQLEDLIRGFNKEHEKLNQENLRLKSQIKEDSKKYLQQE